MIKALILSLASAQDAGLRLSDSATPAAIGPRFYIVSVFHHDDPADSFRQKLVYGYSRDHAVHGFMAEVGLPVPDGTDPLQHVEDCECFVRVETVASSWLEQVRGLEPLTERPFFVYDSNGDWVEPNDPFQERDIVRPRPGQDPLRSGCSQYGAAIVLIVDPFTIVSPSGDMVWSSTVRCENFEVVGRATESEWDLVKHRKRTIKGRTGAV